MLYRTILGVLFVVALLLTLNERYQEERAAREADATPTVSLAPPGLAVTPGQGVPYPPPPPPLPPGFSTTPSGSYPPPGAGAAQAQTTRPPFAPHRVRLRRAVALLSAPNPDAPTAAELTAGQPANAVDERDGWYLLEANGATGWAPIEAVEEP